MKNIIPKKRLQVAIPNT